MKDKVAAQKCRTCLKSNTKTFPLTKSVTGCTQDITYAQLLREYAKFEYNTDYERNLPQFLCFLCSSQLKSTYAFIQQAQQCNKKLINILTKQLCLQEQVIDLPQQNDKASVSIKEENRYNHADLEDQDSRIFIDNENNNNHDINLDVNTSFIAEPILTTEQIIEYDVEESLASNKSFIAEPILTTEQIIEYNSEDSVEMDNDNFNTETEVEEAFLTTEIEALEAEESLLETESFEHLSDETPSSEEKTLSSETCPEKYNNKEEHNNDHSENTENSTHKQNPTSKTFPCRFCDHIARTASGLKYHNRAKHPTDYKTHKCKFCSFTTTINKYNLFEHIMTVHKELIKTLKSNAISHTNESINANINTLNDNFSTNNFTTEEDENVLENDNEEVKDELSDEDFIRIMLNMKIRKAASSGLARRCEECGKIYANYKCLLAHQLDVHKNKDKFWSCPYCEKKCKRKDGLKFHIRNAHGPQENKPQPKSRSKEKRFMCAECSYTCTTSTVLNIHIRVHHTGEKPYKCDICSKSFVVAHDLKLHSYTHTGEKPYKCSVCSKSFRDPSHMRRHMRLHTNKNPYTCDDCGKGFTQSYNLSVHKRTHLKGNKLGCSVCGKFFKNNSMLNIHQINENHYDEVV